jgi:TRAP-type C4-dicarboxylate transport system permease large subunit
VNGLPAFDRIIPQLLWFVITVFATLMIVTYVPAVSLWPMQTIMGTR